jgi:single-strand selective monofunctional uracil DNA glycosylase
MPRPVSLHAISRQLSDRTRKIDARPKAAFTYCPLDYAKEPHESYLSLYGATKRRVLLLGMNPGPFGMAQTGVPFGDVSKVRDFLGVAGKVGRPKNEHPKRPIQGFACTKSEVSGTRLWGWAEERFGTAQAFFENFFVANYCPLVFMTESGANLTPDKLPDDVRTQIEAACDEALVAICDELEPEWVIGVGAFARKQAERALGGRKEKIGTILHPSPASPKANRGWAKEVEKELSELGLDLWSGSPIRAPRTRTKKAKT